MYTLGINAAFHDSAACLVRNGKVLSAAEEERFTRIKHGKRPIPFSTYELPFNAIHYCLEQAGIVLGEVDHIAYSFDPFLLLEGQREHAYIQLPLEPSAHRPQKGWESVWDPLFICSIVNAPRHLAGGFPHHLASRFKGAGLSARYRWHFIPHHLAHGASAFFPSPFEEAAILTIDGRGEKATTTYARGSAASLQIFKEVHFPHSLGLLYEKVTEYLGFLHSSDEYKVMALASFGHPAFVRQFRQLIQVGREGNYTLHPDLCLEQLMGPRRERGAPFEQRHFDVAHSLQKVLEETVIHLADWLADTADSENLCLAGGVALNCVMNSRLRDQGKFRRIWVQPAAGDAGTALGAALWVDSQERGGQERSYRMEHVFLGPCYTDEEIESFLEWSKVPYRRMKDTTREVAALLADEQIVGWFQGRAEFGPRSLGARSILASPRQATTQQRLNDIKDREDFRPVAPVVLQEEADKWFEGAGESPFMLFVYDVRSEKRELIPAVKHIDGTARIQTVRPDQHPLYYNLVKEFDRLTGVPVLVNTSFNTRGEPIVSSPRDALACFWTSPIDALAIGPFLVEKAEVGQCR
ncbi:MAG TPA: carbamoyltransferase C-terminal domain-containing protein [Acidobacteriota bacterium]|nr:carbamoyltransferase C-terminal domain-containing protein [Acidobacteriota bacterium]